MATWQMRAVALYMRATAKRTMASEARADRRMRRPKDSPTRPTRMAGRHDIERFEVAGRPIDVVRPCDRPCIGGVLYLHGGAFVSEIAAQHWSLVDQLTEAGLAVAVPHYGLAPDHTVDDAYPLLTSVHERMVAEHGIDHTAIMGDSAGGTLALGLAQRLAAAGRPGSHLCLISPWLDLALTNPAIPDVEARDPWLSSVGLRHVARTWSNGRDLDDPAVSPLRGPTRGLPPVHVLIGDRDLFLPDVRAFVDEARAAGVDIRSTECPGAIHVYPLLPTPEGASARRSIVDALIRDLTTAP
ncbi:alpha/beta hydrolase fold domain-containing protein [Rhodococcus sp. BP-349]|uniref:alpha/beta hydrolase fold domain-containing protein n=1 Tax=unclassified Rhodococcus (in: high G+C Gram-positive bacteria) TaxID=192944 RepID=UPI001C9B0814|nr:MULTISPECIES: alpha/beta hydrolase [unclassified Rhodococcus (in: high G+C Gram-positive bacteria)]MBY6538437.1 alpha/beta hydrolase fold domain-containing protein [Rhodococcus sp. BP-363]MBY6542774.1 alpha/beta hydrolase fold domain-containing protein [Rhodococcus sp. BP-369]MBY6562004.1 alpha/beta hydrolase fold domain-containing protein [Rhodococcus sp. BP-370]MBY6576296.1 alpha/beta hydrolase fold domain-containing protein [Rhodococcus sp. BP-364]MBY6585597.1 alpha/beta hydrolase fold d